MWKNNANLLNSISLHNLFEKKELGVVSLDAVCVGDVAPIAVYDGEISVGVVGDRKPIPFEIGRAQREYHFGLQRIIPRTSRAEAKFRGCGEAAESPERGKQTTGQETVWCVHVG